MSRTLFSYRRPQLEALEDRFAPGSLFDTATWGQSNQALYEAARTMAATTAMPVVQLDMQGNVVGIVEGATSTVKRTENGISVGLTASGQPPGVYTFWMRVDAPGKGPVSGQLAGHVVGQGGNLNFSAHVKEGEFISGNDHLPAGNAEDLPHARITLVVRYHGEAEPGRIHEQTHTFEDGIAFNYLRSVHAAPPA